MLELRQLKLNTDHTDEDLRSAVIKTLKLEKLFGGRIPDFTIIPLRKSTDARRKPLIYFTYSVSLDFADKDIDKAIIEHVRKKKLKCDILPYNPVEFIVPNPIKTDDNGMRPVVIGSGPAGLFAAYILALLGLRPIIAERGERIEKRQISVETFWNEHIFNAESNVQFGEGGAGTFSDGKLNTLTKDKYGIQAFVLETFVKNGAPCRIMYDAKPHMGTDVLAKVIKSMRDKITSLGGEYLFDSKVTGFKTKSPAADSGGINTNSFGQAYDGEITGVIINGGEKIIKTDKVILAIGHSARDTFETLKALGVKMEQKAFAMGFRVRHPQSLINESQYGCKENPYLEAADYKLAGAARDGRRIYSFCMCPGGYIVNASSEEKRLCVNGMSYSKRDGAYANSAVIAALEPCDFPVRKGESKDDPLLGMYYQRELEEKAYSLGGGRIPAQSYEEFAKAVNMRSGNLHINSCDIAEYNNCENADWVCADKQCPDTICEGIKGDVSYADLTSIFPKDINEAFIECMGAFGRKIKGFDGKDAMLYALEARTSSPVRILRDDKHMSSIKGLYPCGEGAGYAGGIMSAAVDGIKTAMNIAQINQ